MSAESKSEATWRAFFTAAINAGVGMAIGMIAGYVIGSIADIVVLAATGQEQVRYAYILAEIGTYVGLFLGIAMGIGTGIAGATAVTAGESSEEMKGLPSGAVGQHVSRGVAPVGQGEEQDQPDDNSNGLGGAAAA